jgi:hypothetical protein
MNNESDDKFTPPISYHSDLNFFKDEVIVVSDIKFLICYFIIFSDKFFDVSIKSIMY